MTSSVFKNGEPIASDLFSDRAFIYADGFFETMRVVNANIPLLEYHLARALRSAQTLKIPLSETQVTQQVQHCLAATHQNVTKTAIYKLIVSRGEGGRGGYPPADGKANLYSFIRPHFAEERPSVSLRLVGDTLPTQSSFAGLKLINRLEYSVATQGLTFGENEEALFVDRQNTLVETMHHNLFFIVGNKLCTPRLFGFGVKGVARQVLIENIAPKLNVTVEEGEFSLAELQGADGAFISNAVEGLVAVNEVAGAKLKSSSLTAELKRAMDDLR